MASPAVSVDEEEGSVQLREQLARLNVNATVHSSRQPPASEQQLLRRSMVVKSLVFSMRGDPASVCLVVAPLEAKVDLTRLAAILACKRNDVRLADPSVALSATGFPVGSIPPVGHLHGPLRTLVEASLLPSPESGMSAADVVLLGGGGTPHGQLELTLAELMRVTDADLVSVVRQAPSAATAIDGAAPAVPQLDTATPRRGNKPADAPVVSIQDLPAAAAALDERLLPLRPLSAAVAGVLLQVAAADAAVMTSSTENDVRTVSSAPLFTVEATIARVRRMGRLLAFATLARPVLIPPVPDPVPRVLLPMLEMPPDAPVDTPSTPQMQAIIGRTFAAGVGDPGTAARLLRHLRPGRRVRFLGRVQSNPRSDGSCDLVTAAITLLDAEDEWVEEDSTSMASGSMPSEELQPEDDDELVEKNVEWEVDDVHSVPPRANLAHLAGPPARKRNGSSSTSSTIASSGRKGRSATVRSGTLKSGVSGALPVYSVLDHVTVHMVTTAEHVTAMATEVCSPSSTIHAAFNTEDGIQLPPVAALDAEWRPFNSGQKATPVALLQIGTRRRVYLVDMLALADTSTDGMAALDAFLSRFLFTNDIVKLGFGLKHDLTRMFTSYAQQLPSLSPPHRGVRNATQEPVVARPSAVLELRDAAMAAASEVLPSQPQGGRRLAFCGLKTLCRLVLGMHLDKTSQISDWAARPLSAQQLAYAAADVDVCCSIFDNLMRASPRLRSQWRFLLDSPPPGTAASAAAAAVSRSASEDGTSTSDGDGAVESTPPVAPYREYRSGQRGDKVPLHELCVDVDALMLLYLAVPLPSKGRDAALMPLAPPGGQAAQRARGAGGARGGAVFTSNAVFLFMNCEPVAGKVYPNIFWRRSFDGALMVSWFGSPDQTANHPHVQRLRNGQDPILLFARLPRGHYTLLGRLACEGYGIDEADEAQPPVDGTGLLLLRMRLLDAERLVNSREVAHLFKCAQGEAGTALIMRHVHVKEGGNKNRAASSA